MIDFLLTVVQAVLSIAFVLLTIALVHEFGHYITAKMCGVWVLEYAIGFGNRIFKKKWGETLYSLRPFPFGGFVRLAGMDNIEEEPKDGQEAENPDPDLPMVPADHPKSYMTRPFWAKTIVLSAGSIMNMVWAAVLFIIIYTISGGPITNIQVIEAVKGKPAYNAGIRSGDIITSIADVKLTDYADGVKLINNAAGVPLKFTVLRNHPIRKSAANGGVLQDDAAVNDDSYEIHDQETLEFTVIPEGQKGAGLIGISLAPNNYDFTKLPFLKSVEKGISDAANVVVQTVNGLYKMVTRQTQADVAGPVKIMKMITDQSSKGIFDLFYLTAILSVNIGLINLLPFPFVDGGRIFFVLLGALFSLINRLIGTKLQVTPNVEETIHFFGMVAILLLMVFVTYKDIVSFF